MPLSNIISPKSYPVNSRTLFKEPFGLVFFGTPEFANIILKSLVEFPASQIIAVVTALDKPKGRGQNVIFSPVKQTASKHKIKIFQPEKINLPEFIQQLKLLEPDVFLTAAYGQILPKEILALPKHGAFNIHASLLPKYRGPSPIQTAILNGDKKTGVSVISMSEKMDAGPLVWQKETEIGPKETAATLHDKLARLGALAAKKTIELLAAQKITLKSQDENKATYTKILTKHDGQIDWQKPAEQIERQIRAFYPWPGSFSRATGKVFKIIEAEVLPGHPADKSPGELFLTSKNQLAFAGKKNALLPKKIQPQGKRILINREFTNGYKDLAGLTFS